MNRGAGRHLLTLLRAAAPPERGRSETKRLSKRGRREGEGESSVEKVERASFHQSDRDDSGGEPVVTLRVSALSHVCTPKKFY
jgi:hypothetical protein